MFEWLKQLIVRNVENPQHPITDEALLEKLGIAGAESASGIRVTPEKALQNPAVYRGVSLISGAVAKVPLVLYRRGSNDSRDRATDHPAYRLLKLQPHELYHYYNFKSTIMLHALLWGNAYAYIERDANGDPQSLMILDPDQTTLNSDNGYFWYSTVMNDTDWRLPIADVLHIKGLSPDGLLGWYTVQLLKHSIGLGLALQEYGARFFKNNARPSVVVILPPGKGNKNHIKDFKEQWAVVHQGLTQAHGIAAMANGTDVKTFGGSNEEGQWIESREFDLIAVANALNLNANKLGAAINSSYNSLEMDGLSYLGDTLDPWFAQWEAECDVKLLREREKDDDSHYFEFNRKALIQTDAKTEDDILTNKLNNGGISWEEYRRITNSPTYKDPNQEWRRPANIVTNQDPQPQPQEQPQQPQPEQQQPNEAQQKLEAQTKKIVGKLFVRMAKAVEGGKTDLSQHRDIIIDHLSVWPQVEQWTDNLIMQLQGELDNVLPEQRQTVFDRADLTKLVEELWKR